MVIISLANIRDIKNGFIYTNMVVTVEVEVLTVVAATMEFMKGSRGNLGGRWGRGLSDPWMDKTKYR